MAIGEGPISEDGERWIIKIKGEKEAVMVDVLGKDNGPDGRWHLVFTADGTPMPGLRDEDFDVIATGRISSTNPKDTQLELF